MARVRGAFTKARPSSDARQRAWAAMRFLRTFTAPELQMGAEIAYDNLKKYLTALEKAGYVKRLRPKRNGEAAGHVVWVLIRNTGPKHPIARRNGKGVYDPNTDEVFPTSPDGEVETRDEQGGVARRTTPGL